MVFPSTPNIYQTSRADRLVCDINVADLTTLSTLNKETISHADALNKRYMKALLQTMSSADQANVRSMARRQTNFVVQADAISRSMSRRISNVVANADAVSRNILRVDGEVMSSFDDANMLTNPLYSDYPVSPGAPTGWNIGGGAQTWTRDTSDPFSPLNAAKVSISGSISNGGVNISQNNVVAPTSGRYLIEVWVKTDGNGWPRLKVVDADAVLTILNVAGVQNGTTWNRCAGFLDFVAGTHYTFQVVNNIPSIAGEAFYVDSWFVGVPSTVRSIVRRTTSIGAHTDSLGPRTLSREQTQVMSSSDAVSKNLLRLLKSVKSEADAAALRAILRRQVDSQAISDADLRTIVRISLTVVSHSDAAAKNVARKLSSATTKASAASRNLARTDLDFKVASDPIELPENLVSNPGFETYTSPSSVPDGWTNDSNGDAPWSKETTIVHSGVNSAKIVDTGVSAQQRMYQDIGALTPGQVYEFSFWARGAVGGEAMTTFILQASTFIGVAGTVAPVTTTWTKYTQRFTTPYSGSTYRLYLGLTDSTAGGTTIYFDDVQVSRVANRSLVRRQTEIRPVADSVNRIITKRQVNIRQTSAAIARTLARTITNSRTMDDSIAPVENLLTNGGFETWTTSPGAPDSWSADGGTITKETTIIHSGSNAAKIVDNGAGATQRFVQGVNGLVAGQPYEITYWARGAVGGEFIRVFGYDTVRLDDYNTPGLLLTTTWTKYTTRFIVLASGHLHNIYVGLSDNQATNTTAYFDDVVLSRVSVRTISRQMRDMISRADQQVARTIQKEGTESVSHADARQRTMARRQTQIATNLDTDLRNILRILQVSMTSTDSAVLKNILRRSKEQRTAVGTLESRNIARSGTSKVSHSDGSIQNSMDLSDASGNGHNGTEVGAAGTIIASYPLFGTGRQQTATTQGVDVGAYPTPTAFTIEGLFSPDALDSSFRSVAAVDTGSSTTASFAIFLTDTNKFRFEIHPAPGPSDIDGPTAVIGTAYWLVCQWDGTTMSFWVNGALQGTLPVSAIQPFVTNLRIGTDGAGRGIIGKWDEWRYSDIARYSGSTIVQPTAPYTPDANTKGLWHLNALDISPAVRSLARRMEESITRLDTDRRNIVQVMKEVITMADSVSKNLARRLSNIRTASNPAVVRSLLRSQTQTVSDADVSVRTLARLITTVIANNDAVSKNLLRKAMETMQQVDGLQRSLLRKSLSSATHLDVDARQIIRIQAQIATHTDGAVIRDLLRRQVDVMVGQDAVAKNLARKSSSSYSHLDALARTLARRQTDPLTHLDADARKILREATEAIGHADALARMIARKQSVSMSHSDALLRSLLRSTAVAMLSSSEETRNLVRFAASTASHVDAMNRSLARGQTETIDHDDSLVRTILRKTIEPLTVLDADNRIFPNITLETIHHADAALRYLVRTMEEQQALQDAAAKNLLRSTPTESMTAADQQATRALSRSQTDTKIDLDADVREIIRISLEHVMHQDAASKNLLRTNQEVKDVAVDQASRSIARILAQATTAMDEGFRRSMSKLQTEVSTKQDEIKRALARQTKEEFTMSDENRRRIMRTVMSVIVRDTDAMARSIVRRLQQTIQHQDAASGETINIDFPALLAQLEDGLWFLNMWQPQIFGPLINQLRDVVRSSQDVQTTARLIDDLNWFRNQWLPQIYGAFLAGADDAVRRQTL